MAWWQDDTVKALNAVHSRFYLSETTVGIVLVGPGLVGATFLEQVAEQVCTPPSPPYMKAGLTRSFPCVFWHMSV